MKNIITKLHCWRCAAVSVQQAKEKSEPASVEHNYLDPPDSVPLHSGNDASGNSGNDDYHSGVNEHDNVHGNGHGHGHGNGNVNSNGIGNGNANGKGDHRRQGKKNGGNGRQGPDFDDPVIFVDQMETTEFVHRISITEPTTTTPTTMATTTTIQPPSK